jgi:hypothetical protein
LYTITDASIIGLIKKKMKQEELMINMDLDIQNYSKRFPHDEQNVFMYLRYDSVKGEFVFHGTGSGNNMISALALFGSTDPLHEEILKSAKDIVANLSARTKREMRGEAEKGSIYK